MRMEAVKQLYHSGCSLDSLKMLSNTGLLHLRECLVNGQWTCCNASSFEKVVNPATGDVLGEVPNLGRKETEKSIEAALVAQEQWKKVPSNTRSGTLLKWYELIKSNRSDLAAILTLEQGKTLQDAAAEIDYASDYVLWFAEEARRLYGETLPIADGSKRRTIIIRQPIGVIAAITPWNFPAAMVTRKVAPAVGAGCAVVLRPSSQTPFTALALADLAQQAGFPNGVLNVITGPAKEIGEILCSSEGVRLLSFTGSTETGSALMRQCAPTVKKLALELGGNAPFIVCEDADVQAAVSAATAAKLRNAGQSCIAPNRFYVHESLFESFVSGLQNALRNVTVGDGTADDASIGPLINEAAARKCEEHIADAKAKVNASVHTCGILSGVSEKANAARKNYVLPAIVCIDTLIGSEPTPEQEGLLNLRIMNEETFGPTFFCLKYRDTDAMLRHANATQVGLASYLFTNDSSKVWRISEALETGMVAINSGTLTNVGAPFGGVKFSGIGREGGRQGFDEYTETKYMSWRV